MRQPEIYSASQLRNWPVDTELLSGEWVPARPIGHNLHSIGWRWLLAWKVLIGEADALGWQDKKAAK